MKRIFAVLLVCLCASGALLSCGEEEAENPGSGVFDTRLSADDKTLSELKDGGCVVFEDFQCTAGEELWQDFYTSVCALKPASVRVAQCYSLNSENVSAEYYEQEKDNYPRIHLVDLAYDGSVFRVTTRQSADEEADSTFTFKHLMKYTGAPSSPYALFRSYEYYVLVDDDTLTWEEIERGMFSSQAGASIPHFSVYTKHCY